MTNSWASQPANPVGLHPPALASTCLPHLPYIFGLLAAEAATDAKKPEGVLGQRHRGPRAGHGDLCCSASKSATQGPQAERETLYWGMSKTQGVYILLSFEYLTLCFMPGHITTGWANKNYRLAFGRIYIGGSCLIFSLHESHLIKQAWQ